MISHFIHLLLSMWFLFLVSTLHTLVVATSDKPRTSFVVVKNNLLLTEYAWNLNTLRKSPIEQEWEDCSITPWLPCLLVCVSHPHKPEFVLKNNHNNDDSDDQNDDDDETRCYLHKICFWYDWTWRQSHKDERLTSKSYWTAFHVLDILSRLTFHEIFNLPWDI